MIQSVMIERAQIGSARGAATVWIRHAGEGSDHRGTFWFRADHDEEVQRLLKAGAPVELVGWVAGEKRRLTTRILSAEPGTGLAVLEGSGELVEEPRCDEAITQVSAELAVCQLGAELQSLSKERQPSGWLVWGNYGCCGMILLEGLDEEPMEVAVGKRRFKLAAG